MPPPSGAAPYAPASSMPVLMRGSAASPPEEPVVTKPALPGLADLVEDGEVAGERVEAMLRGALDSAGADVDELALGCTHYGFLRPALEALVACVAGVTPE